MTPPFRRVRIKNYIEMMRDGVLAFFDGEEFDPDMPALSRYVYCDTDEDVPPGAVVFPGDNSPEDLKTLEDILGNFARALGWDGVTVGDEQ